jgi:hypothetical protein
MQETIFVARGYEEVCTFSSVFVFLCICPLGTIVDVFVFWRGEVYGSANSRMNVPLFCHLGPINCMA